MSKKSNGLLIMKRLVSRSWEESRLLWSLAFPVLLAEMFQFSFEFVTTAFVGHLGEVELAAVTVAENILDTFAYGLLVSSPMSAMELRCVPY